MIILSNGFPTNMPNSEKFSQGGPANFARLFYNFIAPDPGHQWIGVMIKNGKGHTLRLKRRLSLLRREYHCLYLPQGQLRLITKAKRLENPEEILKKPIARLTSFIKEKNPDVVFLNGFGVFNWMLLIAARNAGIPSVIQHAGILTKELHVHRNLYSPVGLKIMEEMEKDSTRLTSAEIFLNSWSKHYYQKNILQRKDHKSFIIPLPFNFSTFKESGTAQPSQNFKLDPKKFHIGVIARWDEIKNHAAILALAKEIKKQGLNWQIHSVTEIPDNLRYQSQKKEYQKHISVVSPLDRSGIADFCHSMDMLIQPSHFDVSPTVVLEAMALNTPIAISPTIGYVNDFIQQEAGDWVIDWSNMGTAIKKIAQLQNRPMPAALRKHLLETHEQQRVFSSYLKLFSELAKSA